MQTKQRALILSRLFILVLAVCLFAGVSTVGVSSALAGNRTEARQIVVKSTFAFQNFVTARDMQPFRNLVKRAKGILIIPQMLKGAFLIGVSGGSGVFLARNARTGGWSDPAFYTLGGASFGLQVGGQSAAVVILAMTQRGVNAFLNSSIKLGANVGLTAGPVGAGASAGTQNLSADLISFSRSKGLFAGISLSGAVAKVRGGWNDAYYDKKISPRDILLLGDARNPQANGLIETVGRAAG